MRAATTVTRADGVTATATRWHSRLGHLHLDGLIKLNTLVTDFEFKRVGTGSRYLIVRRAFLASCIVRLCQELPRAGPLNPWN
jgi:hypothetical protein